MLSTKYCCSKLVLRWSCLTHSLASATAIVNSAESILPFPSLSRAWCIRLIHPFMRFGPGILFSFIHDFMISQNLNLSMGPLSLISFAMVVMRMWISFCVGPSSSASKASLTQVATIFCGAYMVGAADFCSSLMAVAPRMRAAQWRNFIC